MPEMERLRERRLLLTQVGDNQEPPTSLTTDQDHLIEMLNQRCARVYHLAIALLGTETEVIEVMEEVLVRLYQEAPLFDHDDTMGGRLDTLTIQVILKHLEQSPSALDASIDAVMPTFDDSGHHRERPLVDWSQSLEQVVTSGQGQEVFRRAIVTLPPLEKVALVLKDLEAYSLQEISAMLGLSRSDIKYSLHRARLALVGHLSAALRQPSST